MGRWRHNQGPVSLRLRCPPHPPPPPPPHTHTLSLSASVRFNSSNDFLGPHSLGCWPHPAGGHGRRQAQWYDQTGLAISDDDPRRSQVSLPFVRLVCTATVLLFVPACTCSPSLCSFQLVCRLFKTEFPAPPRRPRILRTPAAPDQPASCNAVNLMGHPGRRSISVVAQGQRWQPRQRLATITTWRDTITRLRQAERRSCLRISVGHCDTNRRTRWVPIAHSSSLCCTFHISIVPLRWRPFPAGRSSCSERSVPPKAFSVQRASE